jgi:predicted RNA binding protein YcfA (HicA-like mRNA interferase family)
MPYEVRRCLNYLHASQTRGNLVPTRENAARKLKAAGFIEVRSGKGGHLLLKHPTTGKEVWVAVHTKKDAGRLGYRILREAGVE